MSLSDQFTDEQIDEFKEAFTLFDKNQDGSVPESQVNTILRGLGIIVTDEELQTMVDASDGTIDFPEFLALLGKIVSSHNSEEQLKIAFSVFDKDEDGYLTVAELKSIMMNMGEQMTEQEVNEMIAEADSEGTGHINIDLFAKIIAKK